MSSSSDGYSLCELDRVLADGPSPLALPESERNESIQDAVLAAVAATVRLPTAKLDPNASLRDLGVDSIMTLEIATEIEGAIGIRLSAAELSDGPSPRDIATKLQRSIEAQLLAAQ